MKKNMKLTIVGDLLGKGFFEHIRAAAEKNHVAGTLQKDSTGAILIYVQGTQENIEYLIDAIYAAPAGVVVEDLICGLCVSSKDFRGVFRLIGSDVS